MAERAHYVYVQHARTVSRRGGAILVRGDDGLSRDPGSHGPQEELLKVDGRVREKHRYVDYNALLPRR